MKQAVKLLMAFAPWLIFWAVAGHSMQRLYAAIIVGAALVSVMGFMKLHRGAILWAGVLFFSLSFVMVIFLKNMWFIKHLGILATGTLFLFTLFSILLGHPFTEDYSRENTPESFWNDPGFIRGNYTITTFWMTIFLINVAINFYKLGHAVANEALLKGLELLLIFIGVAFSTIFSERARKKRGEHI